MLALYSVHMHQIATATKNIGAASKRPLAKKKMTSSHIDVRKNGWTCQEAVHGIVLWYSTTR